MVNKSQKPLKPLKPISAELVLGAKSILKEPRLLDDWVLWLEQRPNEEGRTTALIRPWFCPECPPQELTPRPINLRSKVHGYGGGVLASFCDGDELLVAWIDDCDGSLWEQSWQGLSNPNRDSESWLTPINLPICLSSKSDYALADGLIDPFRKRWIGVMERDGKDFLVSFFLHQKHQYPKIIHRPKDFAGYAALSPDGNELAWVEWQQPSMPWDASQLWWGRFNSDGEIEDQKLLAGSCPDDSRQISVFQPIWLASGELLVAEDSSGWWNLMLLGRKIDQHLAMSWNRLWNMKADTAFPQWVYGMSTAASTGERIVTFSCKKGSWRINLLSREGLISDLRQPFDELADLNANKERLVAIASNPLTESGLLEVDLSSGIWLQTTSRRPVLEEAQISVPESFWFEGFNGQSTHAWYYPPANWTGLAAPLLVKSHSGPTGMAGRGLNLEIQYWTSRGWGVVDVNYGGSTGFGREYRERLKSGWGEVDVFDCSAAAKSLVAAGKADSQFLAIEGGSAGGFTTLACLCFTDVFRVGACRYAVSNLIAMTQETHRFEAGYLDYLVGPWPENRQRYLDRSPLISAEKINCPVVFFQGMKDKVVLPAQTEKMAAALKLNNVPVEVHTFPDEGHGFRDSRVKIKVLEYTERFFRKHLGL